MATEFIVAIELGSSKITGIVGKKNLDNSLNVLAVVKEDSSSCIRRGVVYNIDRTMQALNSIKSKLEQQLGTKIRKVYVGVGGQSILSVKNLIVKDMTEPTIVTQAMINQMMDTNRTNNYPDQEILDSVPLEYKVDSQRPADPVGVECSRLEGNFLNILWRRTFYKNLNKCFEKAGIAIAEMRLAPLALADSVLTDAEKRTGCVLVDLGAETTTVQVYFKGVLRHLAVIPLGGNNITKDIATLQIEEAEAEKLKLKHASAFTENADINPDLRIPIDNERQVEHRKFVEIVESRLEEIIKNCWAQVNQTEFADKLLGGIILTGGGANMKNIERAFREHTKAEKIRIAKTVIQPIDGNQREITARDCTMNTILGLLAKGDENCAGEELKNDIFASEDSRPDAFGDTGSLGTGFGTGKVQTPAEKKAEEERRRQEEEAEAERQRLAALEAERQRQAELEAERQRLAELEAERNKPGVMSKMKEATVNFMKSLFTPESE